MRFPVFDTFNFFGGLSAETAITFVQISIELSETSKVLASQPGHVFQSDDFELIWGTGSIG